jgi:hypothetical protein
MMEAVRISESSVCSNDYTVLYPRRPTKFKSVGKVAESKHFELYDMKLQQ